MHPLNQKVLEPSLSASAVLAAKGRSFYWASHFLGSRHADRATRLYRLCRYIDDIADESSNAEQAHQSLSEITAAMRSANSSDPIIQDGLELFQECDIDPEIFIDLISGVQSDLASVKLPDMDALLHYCYQVAGTVGLMMCKALDSHDDEAYAHAIDLGIAMQLTNICRDVQADALMGRRYLPASLVGELTPAELLKPTLVDRRTVQSAISQLLVIADTYYRSGEQGLFHLPLRARAGILLSARIYQGIGRELQRGKLCFWGKRAVVSPLRKSLITVRALAKFVCRHIVWIRRVPHNSQLHHSLRRTLASRSVFFSNHAQ